MQYDRIHNFQEGTTIVADQIDDEFNAIKGVVNGNISDDNIADASITESKIVTNAVSTAKIEDDAVTAEKTEELPKLVNRQDVTTNSVVSDQLIQYGWGTKEGANTTDLTETVTFPIEYDSAPVVFITTLGAKATSAPTAITQIDGDTGAGTSIALYARSITTSNFLATWRRSDGATFSATSFYCYSWIAIGTKAR